MSLSIRKRGKYWYIRGTIRVGEKKAIIQERSTGISDRGPAEAFRINEEKRIQDELIHGRERRQTSLSFADAGTLYKDRPGGLHPNDKWRVRELNDVVGDYAYGDVMEGWERFKQVRCKGLTAATVNRFRDTLQAALNYAGKAWQITAPQIPRETDRSPVRLKFLTLDQEAAMIAAYGHAGPIARMFAFQGPRTQEALQLQWPHVSFDTDTLFFDRTKNGNPRQVPMHSEVRKDLHALWIGQDRPQFGNVFLKENGKPYPDTRDYKLPGGNPLRGVHMRACKAVGIEDFRVHDWRHHWASWCVMEGVDLLTLKKLGGWKKLTSVERYAALSDAHMKTAIEKRSGQQYLGKTESA